MDDLIIIPTYVNSFFFACSPLCPARVSEALELVSTAANHANDAMKRIVSIFITSHVQ